MKITLTRIAYLTDCTLGVLNVNGQLLHTIERPWLPAAQAPAGLNSVSCVPDGIYALFPHNSSKFPNTVALHAPELGVFRDAVPQGTSYGRAACLIHAGNYVVDVHGCIAVGTTTGIDRPRMEHAVWNSRKALDILRAELRAAGGAHVLEIAPTPGAIFGGAK
jgi:hypothetical protein